MSSRITAWSLLAILGLAFTATQADAFGRRSAPAACVPCTPCWYPCPPICCPWDCVKNTCEHAQYLKITLSGPGVTSYSIATTLQPGEKWSFTFPAGYTTATVLHVPLTPGGVVVTTKFGLIDQCQYPHVPCYPVGCKASSYSAEERMKAKE